MAYDMASMLFDVDPSVPHHLMGIVAVLGQAHGIGDATGSVVRLAAEVSVRVREDNLHAPGAHTSAATGAHPPVVVPTAYMFYGHTILVVVVVTGILATIKGPLAFGVVGIALGIPILAQALVAAILHGPHRVLGRGVDVEHLATILGFVDVEHLAATDGSSAMRVVEVAHALHLYHVLPTDRFIAALVEEYAGVVAVIYDGIAHEFHAVLPLAPLSILFGIAGWHGLDEAHAVTRLHILLPWCHMHPPHEVGVALHHHAVRVVAEPCRHTHAHGGPLIAGTLGEALHHQHAVVEPYLTFGKACLAEARAQGGLIKYCTLLYHTALHRV